MAVYRHRWLRVRALGLGLWLALGALARPAAAGPGNPRDDPPPTWRFRDADRSVKVVVLAGSIGAWQRMPYARHLEDMCANVEVRNLSKTGYGAWALKQRFRQQVLQNPRVNLRNPEHEYWLVFQGGLNSVAMPESTNRHIRALFLLAHARGMRVVGLSLTPWGDERDKRWRGASGLAYLAHTRAIVDFVLGRSDPHTALGRYVSHRPDPEAPWDPAELADIAIDLYDSRLRDAGASPRDVEKMKSLLQRDPKWRRAHADEDEETRAARLDADATLAAQLPQWYLREELRSFDHIHPNQDGHRLIAEIMCPQLPEQWGCQCPTHEPEPVEVAPDEG
jgi:hypothetical protein